MLGEGTSATGMAEVTVTTGVTAVTGVRVAEHSQQMGRQRARKFGGFVKLRQRGQEA